ncbi:hypothetical protein PoB_003580300 [Plakobranchus ocellatus]|uniref:Uncharacterized protein n=1 Tax=Plakobranchus ocellatus TaxID=259542 RepID=A0AAV4ARV4_9GAST|nr:hypothetical protein PoB_003580300 [Plakobranchus ocellatus]
MFPHCAGTSSGKPSNFLFRYKPTIRDYKGTWKSPNPLNRPMKTFLLKPRASTLVPNDDFSPCGKSVRQGSQHPQECYSLHRVDNSGLALTAGHCGVSSARQ